MVKIKTTKIIPAVPERTYTEPAQQVREETIETIICDCCGKPRTRYREMHQCLCCSRDVCRSCSIYDPTNQSDYPKRWCNHCATLYNTKYKALLFQLEEQYDEKQWAIQDNWKTESLAIEGNEQ